MKHWAAASIAWLALGACGGPDPEAGDPASALVLYSSLAETETRALSEAYTAATGTPVNYMLDAADVLIDKMAARAHRPEADLLLVAGTRPLGRAVDEDVLRPAPAGTAFDAIPPGLRDGERYWIGLAADSLAIVYRPARVGQANIDSYAALGGDTLRGQLCLPGSEAESSRSLVAALLAGLGSRDAEFAVRGWMTNLARPPLAGDRELLQALESGACGIAVVGSAALARHLDANPGSTLIVSWPGDAVVGPQLHLLAAGISRHANDPGAAADMLEWLAGPEGQRVLAELGPYQTARPASRTPDMLERHGLDKPPGPGPAVPSASALGAADVVRLLERSRYGSGVTATN
ncbi:MAG: extracellular solute-binding protein [Gammaproteobacteria bacterium]|nr:extracellular solute-binding protein [Gammaproteobacteria bacterium]MDH4254404.1 extracellular solute-binding protein [Gammaproteobacteria bacterium]MDH5309337.1 extracellular solute-binding protein [Gammaproteobacteria bacterium]